MDIITYGNTELLGGVLQGVAYMFFGSKTVDFRGMMLAVGGIGFVMALIAYAFSPRKLVGWYWIATVLCVSAVLIMPKTDVQVIDRLQNCGTVKGVLVPGAGVCVFPVSDVPYVLALVASTTSKIGDKLTEMFEDTFQTVAYNDITNGNMSTFVDNGFRGNGMMFGNKLIREAARVSFPDPSFRYNLTKYLDNCAGPDLSDGTISVDQLRLSTDIWTKVMMKGGNPARYSPIIDGGVMPCDAFRDLIDGAMDGQVTKAKVVLASKVNSDDNGQLPGDAAATDKLDAQITQAYMRSRLQGDVAAEASAMIRQNAMINALADAKSLSTQRTNDPTAMMMGMAEAQAKISTNSSWITSAKIAEQAMPLIRNGIEAILYAAFPIMVLMCLLLTGATCAKLIGSYASALLWIQLWPPLYAVLNYMASSASARHMASAGVMPGGGRGLSLLTSASIYENSVSDLAVVGYLVVSIPVFAWAIVKGMEAIGGGALAGASAFSSGSSAGASEAASGGVSLGQSRSEDVRLAPHYSSANYSTWENGFSKGTNDMSSRNLDTMQLKQSSVGIDAGFVSSRADSLSKAASQLESLSISESKQASQTLTAGLAKVSSLSSADSNEAGSFSSGAHGEVTTAGDASRKRSVAGDTHATGEQGAEGGSRTGSVDKSQGWYEETSGGLNLPGALTGGIVSASESAGRRQGSTGKDVDAKQVSHQDIANAAKNAGHMDSVDKSMSYLESFMSSSGFQAAAKHGDSAALSLQATYNDTKSYQESSAAHLQKSHQLSEQAQTMKTNATSIAVSYNNAVAKSINETDGGGGKFAGQLMNSPGEAGQRVSDIVAGLDEDTHKQSFASLGGRSPSENLPPSLPDEEVAAMETAYKAQGPNASAVTAARDANKAEVAAATAGKGLHPADPEVAKPKGGKGGGNPFAAKIKAGKDAVAAERQKVEGQIHDRENDAAGKLDANKNGTPTTLDTKGQDPAVKLGRGISNALSTTNPGVPGPSGGDGASGTGTGGGAGGNGGNSGQ
ncbi:MAG: conjugal transfer protein TraG N-terminal domain-containing protein [Rhizobacter sp.]